MQLEDYISPERPKIDTNVLKLEPEEALGDDVAAAALSGGDAAKRHRPCHPPQSPRQVRPDCGGPTLTGSTI